jgi:hypothetical protein
MSSLVEDIGTHFRGLASTHEILTNFGATQFVENSNLFYIVEPATPNNSVTIIPYGGSPPDITHKNAQYPSCQIRVKASGVAKGYRVTQAIINELHQNNELGSNIPMKCFANQSSPMFLKWDEEDYPVYVCNFDFMHVKYTVS